MPRFKDHVKNCEKLGVDKWICDEVNRYMDEPSQRVLGCAHRKYRHELKDCLFIAKTLANGKSREEAQKAYYQSFLACLKHIEDDCKKGGEKCNAFLPCNKVSEMLYNKDLLKRIEGFYRS
jgi:hypothetical protein